MVASAGVPGRFDIGAVASLTFSVLKANFVPYFLLGLLASGPSTLIPYIVASVAAKSSAPSAITSITVIAALASSIVAAVLSSFLNAAVSYGTVRTLSGQAVTFGAALSVALRCFFPLIGMILVEGFALVGSALLFVVPAFILYVMWSVAIPVLVVEDHGVFGSFSRSSALTKGYRWPVFGTLALFAIGGAIAQAMVKPLGFNATAGAPAWIGIVLTAVVAAIVGVASTTLVACIYYRLRVLKEGIGAEQIAAVFE